MWITQSRTFQTEEKKGTYGKEHALANKIWTKTSQNGTVLSNELINSGQEELKKQADFFINSQEIQIVVYLYRINRTID